MFSILVVPDSFANNEYYNIVPMEEIHPLKLLSIEDSLEELMKNIIKTVKEIERITEISSVVSMHDRILNYTLNFSVKSFENLIEEIGSKLISIQDQIKKQLETKKPIIVDEKQCGILKNEFIFIDYFYCTIMWKDRKKLERLFDPKILIFVKKQKQKAIYKAFCMKNEGKDVKEKINNAIGSKVSITEEFPKEELYNEQTVEVKNNFIKMLEELMDLYMLTAIMKGNSEILNKYGLMGNFRYKIERSNKIEKEKKRIRKLNNNINIEDIVSTVYLFQ
jgi:hypothetical protein